MEAKTATRTDSEFLDEIIQLIDGTHWTKGSLDTYCWVPVKIAPAPEGTETGSRYVMFDEDAPDNPELYHTCGSNIWNEDLQPQECWAKSQWCLMGMVLRVADLYMDEPHIMDSVQAVR